jgi:hypothetical protein
VVPFLFTKQNVMLHGSFSFAFGYRMLAGLRSSILAMAELVLKKMKHGSHELSCMAQIGLEWCAHCRRSRIRAMKDYETPVSVNRTPPRDMVERPSPLCD